VGYSFYFSPLPETSGVKTVAGLNESVTIYRDSWAIPQIYASNAEDLFFAQGYVHAQDRWWQMEITRYLGMGRLHDILVDTPQIWNVDHWMLTLGLAESARLEWENALPETRTALEAYSAGVNAYIQERSMESLASEYGLVGLTGELDSLLIYLGRDVQVEAWEPYHSILVWKLFALSVTPSFWMDLDLAIAIRSDQTGSLQKLANTTAQSLNWPLNASFLQMKPETLLQLRENIIGNVTPELMQALGLFSSAGGNLWVASSHHTVSNAPLLANTLNMLPEIPTVWYEMGLQCNAIQADCPYGMVGFSLVGIPGIVIGHNDQVAWAFNPSQVKTQNLVLLELNPEDKTQYRRNGSWVSFEIKEVNLSVDNGDEDNSFEIAPQFQIVRSEDGPVITALNGDYALALDWAGLDASSDTIGSLLLLNRASNWQSFQEALYLWRYPAVQVAYADVVDNIGLQMAGYSSEQIRNEEDLPSLYNPVTGFIVDVNQPLLLDAEGYWISNERAKHVETLLTRQVSHSPESFAAIQNDLYSMFSADLMPYVQALRFDDIQLQALQTWLRTWDFTYHADNAQAAFFAIFIDYVIRLTFDQPFLTSTLSLHSIIPTLLHYLLPNAEDALWDIQQTSDIENRNDILQQAFSLAYEQMSLQFGEDLTQWQWGDLHQVTFFSRIIGQDEFFGDNLALNSGLFPINQQDIVLDGYFDSLNSTRHITDLPFINDEVDELTLSVYSVPVYRVIIDLADFNNSRAMLSTGQSGHPASDNYKDMIVPWRTFAYHDLRWGLTTVREVSDKRLELEPERR